METVIVQAAALRDFSCAILTAAGVPSSHASLVSDSLVAANLRGVDSHGVQLLLPYLEQIDGGHLNPKACGSVVSRDGPCLLYDGEDGIGQVVADRCTDSLIQLTRDYGLALVVARHSNHFGATAYWTRKIGRAGFIGIAMCNASAAVPPWQGREPRIGTNPISMAVPSDSWVLDMATTTVALGKLYDAAYHGNSSIPNGWAMDSAGEPTTDTDTALKGFMMPLGGYKGSGLGLMAEILCAGLSGGPMSLDVGSLRKGRMPLEISHMFLGIDPNRFSGLSAFNGRVDSLMETIKSSAPAKGYDEVLVAGEPEQRTEQLRLREGIPIPLALWQKLTELAKLQGA